MNILIYSPYPLDNNSMPVLLDEAMEYLQEPSNQVLFVTCSGEIKPCDSNAEQSAIRCAECMFSANLLVGKIDHPNFKHKKLSSFLSAEAVRRVDALRFDYDSIAEVKTICHQEANIGLGVVSSYVSMTRNLEPEFNQENSMFFDDALRASARLVEATIGMLEDFSPDQVCIFNGRFSGIRPVMEVSQARGISTVVLECTFASDREKQHKVKFFDALPHDIDNGTKIIENNWSEWNEKEDKNTVAKSFFERRRKAEMASDTVYTAGQKENELPENWDPDKRNFVIFNSSEDEFFCVGESFDKYKLFENQIEGIRYLLAKAAQDPSIHFYLRIHPNLQHIKFHYHTGLASIFSEFDNITVILASSSVSTYALIDSCEKVFVFGSTTGVEAAYWGKPVVLLGGSFYIHLDVAYYPRTLSELDSALFATLSPGLRQGALKYALYIFGKRGIPPKYVDFDFKMLHFGGKTLSVPRCYSYRGSLLPYVAVLVFFRTLNLAQHLIFKKITFPKFLVEKKYIKQDF
ncbi:hypothetical protein [Janthinobacterium sp. BJB304]|uniref:capsular polysaccharide export protein, LipB/KpsS family n=1 Tax=Janthinobacterium sp. BJB304 TaxID=1572871 RepID=UPI000C101864|nr:hypothetical protein [Janthinobacterium sp. BJB304]PHV38904.1 hypothetical protein CSQ95_11590 [Janthinobacterium sp. BJB304]